MKIHHPEGSSTTLMITPGAIIQGEVPSEWKDAKGGNLRFDIVFKNGVAEVDKKLGEFVIEQGYANRTILRQVKQRLLSLGG